MRVTSTYGHDQATKCVLPFIAANGVAENGEQIDLFLMQEAT